ncbi:MAG: alpha-1,2-fucosyltransferase [Bacteroidota bacterium]
MVVTRIQGGMGNQMFQYAIGLANAKRLNTSLYIDDSLLQVKLDFEHAVYRNYELRYFNIEGHLADRQIIHQFNFTGNEGFFENIWLKIKFKIKPPINIIQKGNEIEPSYLCAENNSCFVGRWQSEVFFKDHAKEVKNAFSIKEEYLKTSREAIKLFQDKPLCAIHVRRGDYVSNPFYAAHLGALPYSYYLEGMRMIREKFPEVRFLVFSNDYLWCREVFRSTEALMAKDFMPDAGAIEEFAAMTLIPHHIISNSTFSWWAAWLAEKESSMVVAPAHWAKTSQFTPMEIIPSRWINIQNSF